MWGRALSPVHVGTAAAAVQAERSSAVVGGHKNSGFTVVCRCRAVLAAKHCYSSSTTMSYRVISFTMAQVRQGALEFQRHLSAVLREHADVKVYSVSPFDLDERRRMKDRFGGDVVYFFNDAAMQECARVGIDLQFQAEVSDEELPRRRTLVVGMPERKDYRAIG